MPAEKQLAYATQIATNLSNAGIPFDYADVASQAEESIKELIESVTAQEKEAAPAADEDKTNGQSKKVPTKPTATLTNSQASQTSAPAGTLTDDDRVNSAILEAEKGLGEVQTDW